MNFLHSQYIARITGRKKTQKKERKLWYDFQSRCLRETFRSRTKRGRKQKQLRPSIPFTNIFFAVNATSNPTRASPRLNSPRFASTRLDSPRLDSTRRWRGGQKSAKRTGVVRKWVKMTSATRTRTERLSNREVIFARDGRGRLSMPPFLLSFFFFFILPAEIQTLKYVTNIYIHIYARTKLVRKRIDGKTNLQGD